MTGTHSNEIATPCDGIAGDNPGPTHRLRFEEGRHDRTTPAGDFPPPVQGESVRHPALQVLRRGCRTPPRHPRRTGRAGGVPEFRRRPGTPSVGTAHAKGAWMT